jgi:hypothetical protein
MKQIKPMTPKEMKESFLASSSIETWRGVFFSPTCKKGRRRGKSVRGHRGFALLTLPVRSKKEVRRERRRDERRTSCIIAKTTPNSLCTPVPTTTPSPLPLLTNVPINATLLLSAIGNPPTPNPESTIASVCFFAGFVSPVKADSSISRPWD